MKKTKKLATYCLMFFTILSHSKGFLSTTSSYSNDFCPFSVNSKYLSDDEKINLIKSNYVSNNSENLLNITCIPNVPDAIIGQSPECNSNSTLNYYILDITDATTYIWNLPVGWKIVSGQGTTSIKVITGTAGQNGNITVTAGNSCGTSAPQTLYVWIALPIKINHISEGRSHSIFTCSNNYAMASGNNNFGQLGDGSNINSYLPVPISLINSISCVSSGNFHSLFLKNDGTVFGCGSGGNGQLATTLSTSIPTQITALNRVCDISAGENHSLFLKKDGTVSGCGINSYGCLGLGSSGLTYYNITNIYALTDIRSIAAGNNFSLFLNNAGKVYGCGTSTYYQLGNTKSTNINPFLIISDIKAIAAGGLHSLFLKNDGTVWSTGEGNYGALGNGGTFASSLRQVLNISDIIAVSAGLSHSLFLKNDGSVWACGSNAFGQLGNGTFANRLTPYKLNSLSNIVEISAGGNSSTFVKSDGTVWACGDNSTGQLGDGTNITRVLPVQVNNLCNALDIFEINPNIYAVYPNPSHSGVFYINNPILKIDTVSVCNILGIEIKFLKTNSENIVIDLQDKPKGVYFLRIKSGNKIWVKKVINK